MKKLLFLLLTIILCFPLVACGNKDTNDSIGIMVESNEDEFEGEVIEFNNTVLVDDDLVRIELVKFYTAENYSDEDNTRKGFCVKCTNKSDGYEMDIWPMDCYVRDEMVMVTKVGGNLIMPGKTAYLDYYFKYERPEGSVQLNSLDDLYDLEGKIKINCFYDDTFDSIEYDLSFKDLK